MKNKYPSIAWDFNGTILDDVMTGIESVNVLLERRGLEKIPDVEYYRSIFTFPITDYYKKLGFDFDKEPFSDIAVEWVNEYLKRAPYAQIRKGIKEALDLFKDNDLKQYIVSASELSMLTKQVKDLSIESYFEKIVGIDNIYALSKLEAVKQWATEVDIEHSYFIGDTVHDYDTASAAGIKCILVSGGHQNIETLSECDCAVVDSFEKASEIILKDLS